MEKCIKCGETLPPGAVYCPACGKKQPDKTGTARKALKRANDTGTVYKLQGRRTRPWVAAKNKVIIGCYPRKTDALEALNKLAGRNISERYNMTFADVFEAWKAEHYKEITDAGRATYDRAFDVFAALHDKKFRDLRTADFQGVIDGHMEKAQSTVAKYKQLITQMSKWAIREELITTNFAAFVRVPEAERTEKTVFTDAEIQKIESAGTEPAYIVCMLLATGMRIGELFDLKTANYHETYVIGGSKTDAGKNRVIPIRPEGRKYFAYFFARSAGMEKLLDSYTGNRNARNFRNREYNKLLKDLGIDPEKSPHTTRHTYTSRAVKEGMPPEILQKILGHADFSTTANIYTHIDAETLVKSVETTAVTNTLLTNQSPAKNQKPSNR